MGRRTNEDVTETELAMLEVLWDRGEATRRQVTDALYPGGAESHYATVQNLLGRLERKGFVRNERREGEGALVFTATVDRDEFIRRRLQGLADRLCNGAVAPLVMNLVRSQPLSSAEIEELYTFLRERRRKPNQTSDEPRK
ncbi:BlaI/MecI/CopY family transcriptional regulator [Singulisphaera rosea]